MEIEFLVPFKVEIVRPPDAMRDHCPPTVWPKICELDYAAHAGPWTAVGVANSETYGAHLLLVQPGRLPEYIPRLACRVISVEGSVHSCPICNGIGYLRCQLPEGLTSSSNDAWRKECHGCGGKGWITI